MRGFTTLELLFVIAILAAIALLAAPPFRSFRDTQVLSATAEEVSALLTEARAASLASKESSSYGVHIESSRTVYFKGTSFSDGAADNKEVRFDTAVEAKATLEGGGADVVFDQLSGETSQIGRAHV